MKPFLKTGTLKLPMFRTHLKNRILVQDRGGAEFKTAGNLLVVEDLKRGTNPAEKGGRPKDIFVMGSKPPEGLYIRLGA